MSSSRIVVGIPARTSGAAAGGDGLGRFDPYGMPVDDADPVSKRIDALLDQVQGLSQRVLELEEMVNNDDRGMTWTSGLNRKNDVVPKR